MTKKKVSIEQNLKNQEKNESQSQQSPLDGNVFVLLGKFSVPRKDLVEEIEKYGGKVTTALTKRVTHVMKGTFEEEGKKTSNTNSITLKKAEESNLPIVDENFVNQVLQKKNLSSSTNKIEEKEIEKEMEDEEKVSKPKPLTKKRKRVTKETSSDNDEKDEPKSQKGSVPRFSPLKLLRKVSKKELLIFEFNSDEDEELAENNPVNKKQKTSKSSPKKSSTQRKGSNSPKKLTFSSSSPKKSITKVGSQKSTSPKKSTASKKKITKSKKSEDESD